MKTIVRQQDLGRHKKRQVNAAANAPSKNGDVCLKLTQYKIPRKT